MERFIKYRVKNLCCILKLLCCCLTPARTLKQTKRKKFNMFSSNPEEECGAAACGHCGQLQDRATLVHGQLHQELGVRGGPSW